jgi:hypothetical protein
MDTATIRMRLDTTEFDEALAEVRAALEKLAAARGYLESGDEYVSVTRTPIRLLESFEFRANGEVIGSYGKDA